MPDNLVLVEEKTEDRTIDPKAIFRLFWDNKWIMAATTAATLAVGAAYLQSVSPSYTARATILLEPKKTQYVNFESVVSGLNGDQSTINTQLEVLRSRRLMKQVSDKLDLYKDPEFKTIAVQIPEDGSIPGKVVENVIASLYSKTKIANVHNSFIFKISATTNSPEKSSRIANAIARTYIDNQLNDKYRATKHASDWLSVRVATLEAELEEAETAVKDFNARTGLMGPSDLDQLNRQAKKTRSDIQEISKRIDRVRAISKDFSTANAAGDGKAMQAAASLLQEELSLTRELSTPLTQEETTLLKEMTQSYLAASSDHKRHLETMLSNAEEKIDRQSHDLVALEQLTRKAKAERSVYEYFLGKLQETSAQQGVHQADSKILSDAPVPLHPSAPNKMKIMVLFGITGFVLGAAWVLMGALLNTSIKTLHDIRSSIRLPLIARIPALDKSDARKFPTLIAAKPRSIWSESFRDLYASLSSSAAEKKVIMITSAMPGEGKTTISVSLAQTLARTGNKVLIIEGDIRCPAITDLKIAPEKASRNGLITVLKNESTLDEAIVSTVFENINLLRAGEVTPEDFDTLLTIQDFKVIEDLKDRYDFIILDTPPVLPVSDTKILARFADIALVVIKWNSTTLDQATDAIHELEAVGTRPSGIILNKIDVKHSGIYGDLKYYS